MKKLIIEVLSDTSNLNLDDVEEALHPLGIDCNRIEIVEDKGE